MTWSPLATLVTPRPTSTTIPAPSWPRIAGNSPSGSCELVGMADPGRLYLDQHLAVFGFVELNLLDVERLTGLESDSSACLHDLLPGSGLTQTDFDATALIAFASYRRQEPGRLLGCDNYDQRIARITLHIRARCRP